ncbi:hypothetical protein [Fischerella thermalis]|nr:hypothetical protein [Fischerella thermalis]
MGNTVVASTLSVLVSWWVQEDFYLFADEWWETYCAIAVIKVG